MARDQDIPPRDVSAQCAGEPFGLNATHFEADIAGRVLSKITKECADSLYSRSAKANLR